MVAQGSTEQCWAAGQSQKDERDGRGQLNLLGFQQPSLVSELLATIQSLGPTEDFFCWLFLPIGPTESLCLGVVCSISPTISL